jgi:hypothetical protein
VDPSVRPIRILTSHFRGRDMFRVVSSHLHHSSFAPTVDLSMSPEVKAWSGWIAWLSCWAHGSRSRDSTGDDCPVAVLTLCASLRRCGVGHLVNEMEVLGPTRGPAGNEIEVLGTRSADLTRFGPV